MSEKSYSFYTWLFLRLFYNKPKREDKLLYALNEYAQS